jgi:hypothetical protein
MAKDKITQGREIRDDIFKGNPHSQLAVLRESIWALDVIQDDIYYNMYEDHERYYTDEDYVKALEIRAKARLINKQIQDRLKEDN